MANFCKNLDLFADEADTSKRDYWKAKHGNASVETVKKNRDLEQESKEMHDANKQLVKDVLPRESTAEDKIKMTPTEAFIEVYPNGKQTPQSAATKPVVVDMKANTIENIGPNVGSLLEKYLKTEIDLTLSIQAAKVK